MSDKRPLYRNRMVHGIVAGAGAALAAGYATQHRLVARTHSTPEDIAAEGLTVPDDCVEHDIDTDDGGTVHVIERGQGPPVVLLHGYMLSSALWAHQLRDLAPHHRVIALDLRGHGRSVPGTSGFSQEAVAPGPVAELRADAAMAAAQRGSPGVRRMARDVGIVLAALDVEHALVVGHSMGGMVALQLVHDMAPDEVDRRIAALALVSTTAGPFTRMPGFGGVTRVAAPVSARAVGLADRIGVRAPGSQDMRWWLTRLGFGADAPPAQVRFVEGLHLATPSSTVLDLLPSIALFDLSKWLGSLDLPVLVVVGSRDRLTPPRHALRTSAALAHSELVELPRCGHMPMIERRHEFARLIEEFADKIA
jgi:pimeloyl-ACP methyl ester carboxylesterase